MFLTIKTLVVVVLLVAGLLILLGGAHAVIPLVKYKGFEAHGLPIGIGVMLLGIVLALFWKIEVRTGNGGDTSGWSVKVATMDLGKKDDRNL